MILQTVSSASMFIVLVSFLHEFPFNYTARVVPIFIFELKSTRAFAQTREIWIYCTFLLTIVFEI